MYREGKAINSSLSVVCINDVFDGEVSVVDVACTLSAVVVSVSIQTLSGSGVDCVVS